MKERPILFSGTMVRAILDGTKTQTRREVNPRGALHAMSWSPLHPERGLDVTVFRGKERVTCQISEALDVCPYGVPGESRLWVRETWAQEDARDLGGSASATIYRATASDAERAIVGRWRPSIHMPRWASRITLEVTSVRVERLHDISEEDALAEGVTCADVGDITAWRAFCDLWKSINGAESWTGNPFVWVVGFRKAEVAR